MFVVIVEPSAFQSWDCGLSGIITKSWLLWARALDSYTGVGTTSSRTLRYTRINRTICPNQALWRMFRHLKPLRRQSSWWRRVSDVHILQKGQHLLSYIVDWDYEAPELVEEELAVGGWGVLSWHPFNHLAHAEGYEKCCSLWDGTEREGFPGVTGGEAFCQWTTIYLTTHVWRKWNWILNSRWCNYLCLISCKCYSSVRDQIKLWISQ